MNQQQIKHFLAIVKHMSLTRAARELYITQPALSNSLAKLEEELGVRLFHRDGNKLRLTIAGEVLHEKFRTLRKTYEEIYELAGKLSAEEDQKLTIGFSGSIMVFLSMNITGFLTSWRQIPIQKIYADQPQIVHMLKSREVDLAIVYPTIDDPEIGTHIIHKDEIVLAVPTAHPLAGEEDIAAGDLKNYSISMLTRSHPFRRNCDELLKKQKVEIRGNEYEYGDYVRRLEEGKYGRDFLGLTTEGNFEKWYGDGYVKKSIRGVKLEQVTGVSWLLESDVRYRYQELIHLIEKEYSSVYDSSRQRLVLME